MGFPAQDRREGLPPKTEGECGESVARAGRVAALAW